MAMLKRSGLADRADDVIETLSGGMQRRVELAKGLLHKPALLLTGRAEYTVRPGCAARF